MPRPHAQKKSGSYDSKKGGVKDAALDLGVRFVNDKLDERRHGWETSDPQFASTTSKHVKFGADGYDQTTRELKSALKKNCTQVSDPPPLYEQAATTVIQIRMPVYSTPIPDTQITEPPRWEWDEKKHMYYRDWNNGQTRVFQNGEKKELKPPPRPPPPESFFDRSRGMWCWLHQEGTHWVFDNGSTYPPNYTKAS